MKFPSTFCWLLSASLFMPLTAQETKKLEKEPSAAERQAEIESLIERLGAERYAKRRDAQEGLKEIGAAAVEALQEAAEGHEDAEVRWRARDLIDQIEAGEAEPDRDLDDGSPLRLLRTRGDERWADILDRMQVDFDLRGMDDLGQFRIQMRDLQDQMRELSQRFESQTQGLRIGGQGFHSSGTSIQIGSDGVRVEVREKDEDGKEQTKVYEAPDMETFKEKYPEVAERYLNKSGVFMIGPDDLRLNFGGGNLRGLDRFPRRIDRSPRPVEVRSEPRKGARLGVSIQPLAPEVGAFLGLEGGQGFVVREVSEGSLAESLELQAGDVIYEINGEPIFSTADIAGVLKGIAKGEAVKLKVNRRGADLDLAGEKLEDADKPSLEKVEEEPAKKAVIR